MTHSAETNSPAVPLSGIHKLANFAAWMAVNAPGWRRDSDIHGPGLQYRHEDGTVLYIDRSVLNERYMAGGFINTSAEHGGMSLETEEIPLVVAGTRCVCDTLGRSGADVAPSPWCPFQHRHEHVDAEDVARTHRYTEHDRVVDFLARMLQRDDLSGEELMNAAADEGIDVEALRRWATADLHLGWKAAGDGGAIRDK